MMVNPLQPYADLDSLHNAAADAFCELVAETLTTSDTFRVSLSGGSTPKRLYEILATRDLPWDRIHWFWGDERNVPRDHDDSNQRMVREAILGPAGVDENYIHPVPVVVEAPADTADQYEQTLRQHFPGDEFPAFDLVLLGMGDDAHTASLFPETDAIDESDRWFVQNWVPKFSSYRYTLTAPAINAGQAIWFLIAGSNKQTAMGQVLGNEQNTRLYPSQLITPTRWFVTADALPQTA
ncbi:6-phosphogluconolactonase [Rubripirellula lacrimiformis]|uniref:6-phosphogluconolactonase n=1 Tax=Rubripirellula lacrimiformis TaxID=1930273 RepID=A0A517NHB5_9BACT|nr:6-phosphogluconolactonase [Rubripirellula lacrimiformis]QDT06529.1 6-phosphogluconolactonase [Rubripirellula lacrimiformis]